MSAALVLLAVLAGCSSAPPPAHSPAAPTAGAATPSAGLPASATGWLQYHGNGQRTGTVAGLPAAGPLSVAWSARLDGAVYGQPLVIGTTVLAGTEAGDAVYGLDLATGAVRWHTTVGTAAPASQQPCGNVSPLGITSTGVYDPQTGLAYFVAQSGRTEHVLVGLDPATGAIKVRQDVPSPDHQPFYDQQRGALALDGGDVYVVFGGHYGDCGPYIGSVVAMPASGQGPILSYLVPTSRYGGIWAPGGPVVGPDGTIYVSVGNGDSQTLYDGSDSVTALTPALQRTGIFAPTDWQALSASDTDLGSTSPALLADGQILQVGKSGTGYLLDARHLGGIGGQIASGQVCSAFGGDAVSGSTVYVPCLTGGLAAVSTAGNRVTVLWRGPAAGWGSPVVGGGAVWVAGPDSGELYELNPATGVVRQQIKVADALPHFVSPSLDGQLVLIGTMTGVTAVSGG